MNKSSSLAGCVVLTPRARRCIACLTSVLALAWTGHAQAQSTWTTAGSGTWTNSGSWTGGVPTSASAVTFNTSGSNGNETIYLNGNDSAASLTFQNTGTTTLLGGISGTPATNTLTLSGGITDSAGAGAVTIGDTTSSAPVNLALSASQTFANNSSNTLEIANGLTSSATTGTQTLTITGVATELFNGVIGNGATGGTIALTQNSSTTTTLNTTNTYTGATLVSSGTLVLKGGSSSSGMTINGGVLNVSTTSTSVFGTGSLNFGATTGNTAELYWNGGSAGTVESNPINVLSTATGTNEVYLNSGSPSFSGLVTLNSGNTLTLVNTNSSGTNFTLSGGIAGTGNVTVNGTAGGGHFVISGTALTFTGTLSNISTNAGGSLTLSANMTGAESLLQNSSTGVTTVSGTNTNSGTTTVSAGTLEFSKEVSLYNDNTASWTASNLIVQPGSTLAFAVGTGGLFTTSDISTLSGVGSATGGFTSGSFLGIDTGGGNFTQSTAISNSNTGANAVGLNKLGSNTLTLTAANNYSGLTTISAGTLQIGSGGTTGTLGNGGSGTVVDNGTLTFDRTDNYGGAISGSIGGTGALSEIGTGGTLTLSGVNTFTGTTTVTAGTLDLKNSLALENSAVTYSTGITFDSSVTSNAFTFGALNGTANLVLQNNASTPAGITLTIGSGSNENSSYSGILSGPAGGGGALTVFGLNNTVSLTGANTYTGTTTIAGGTLNLGGAGATGSINSISALVLGGQGGGTLAYTRTGVVSQTFNGTTIASGENAITESTANQTINLGAITENTGGTVDLSSTGTITTTNGNTNGILGGYATYGNRSTWAVAPAVSGGAITGLSSYTAYNTAASTFAPGATANVDMQTSNTTAALTQTINSLRFNQAAADTLTLGTNQVLTVASGGILVTSGTGSNASTITGGILLGSSGGQLVLNDVSTGTVTIGSQIEDNGAATALVFSGSVNSIINLTNGSNSYSGGTYFNGGRVPQNTVAAGTPFGTGMIIFGDQLNSDTAGGGFSTDGNVTSGLVTMAAGNNSDNGDLGTNGGNPTWTFIGGPAQTATFNGTFGTEQGGRTTIYAWDGGTQILGALSNAGTFNGVQALVVNGGTLQLGNGYSGTVSNDSNNTYVSVGGGTYVEMGNVAGLYNQTFTGGLKVTAGASTVTVNANGGAGTVFSPGAVARSVGGTVNFNLPTGVQSAVNGITTTTTNTNGILGGYATVGGTDWASNATNTSGGNIIGLSSSTINSYTNDTWATGNNTTVTTSSSPTSGSTSNSLRFNAPGAYTVTLAGTNTLTSGGILVTSNVGSNLSSITTGTLTGSASGDLVVIQNNTGGGLTIGSVIANNTGATALTKSGAGLLTLTGANTYTGGLYLNGGTVNAATNNIDGSSTTNGIFFNGGTLQASGAITTAKAVNVGVNGGTIDLNGNAVTLSGAISGVTGEATGAGLLGAFDPTGVGLLTVNNSVSGTPSILTLSNTGNAYYGGVTINGNSTVQNAAASGTGALGAGFLTFGSGSGAPTVDLDGHSATVAGLIGSGTNGVITSSVAGTPTLTLDGTLSETYAGAIQNGSGTVALTIALNNPTETQTLSGTNTYTGATSVSSGILGLTGSLSGSSITTSGSGVVTESSLGSIAGSGVTFTQGSTGTSTLSGTNTYGGATAINSGVLLLNGANAAQNSTVSVNTNGGLAFGTGASTYNVGALSGSGNVSLTNTSGSGITLSTGAGGATTTYSGVLSGTGGALTQAGSGTLTLSNANTYSGGTTAGAGIIITQNATALGTGNVGVSNGAAVLNENATNNAGLTIAGNLTIATGGIIGDTVDAYGGAGNTLPDVNSGITINGNVTTSAGNYTIELIGTPASATYGVINGTQILATATGGSFLTGTPTLVVLNDTNFSFGSIMATATQLSINITYGTTPTAEYWNGGLSGFSTVWSASNGSSSNWVTSLAGGATGLTPGATTTITFSATSPANSATSTTLGTNVIVLGIVVNDSNGVGLADTYTLSIGTGGITVNSGAGATTLAVPIAVVGNQTWTNNSSNLLTVGSLGASITDSSAYTLATSGTGNITINGSLAGAEALTQSGSGTLTLAGSNTYSGGTTISSGTISISADNNLGAAPGTATAGNVVINGGTLATTTNSFTINSNRGIAVGPTSGSGTGSINVASGTQLTYNGILANNGGTGALATTGTGTLSLGGVNTYSGGTTINASSTLQTTNASALGSGAVAENGTLDLDGHSLSVGALSGASTGTITSTASGAITLTTTGSTGTFAGVIQNGSATSLGLTEAGSLTLSGANTYTGTTAVSAGTLNITGSNSGAGAYTVATTGTLTLGGSGTVAASTVTLAGTGATLNLNNGILTVGATGITSSASASTINFNGGTLKSSAVSVIGANNNIDILSGGGTIDTTGGNITSSSTVGNQSTSVGTLTIQGGNTFTAPLGTAGSTSYTLTGANTTLKISAATVTTASTIVTAGAGTIVDMDGFSDSFGGLAGSGSVINSSTAGKTLTLTGSGINNFSGVYSGGTNATTAGTGALTVALTGSGAQTLSGANLFSGATTLTSGTLTLANSLALQNSPLTYNGGTLSFGTLTSATLGGLAGTQNFPVGTLTALTINNATSPAAYSGTIADASSSPLALTEAGSATTNIETLTGANSYTGGTVVNSGGLQGENTGATNVIQAFGTGLITLNGGELYAKANGSGNNQTIITGNGTTGNNVTVGGTTTMDVNNLGANTGSTIQYNNLSIGAYTLNATGANNYALQFAGTTTLTGNATFNLAGLTNTNLTLTGVVSDGGSGYSITKTGAATLYLYGNNTFSGGITDSVGSILGGNTGTTNTLSAFGTGTFALNTASTLFLRANGSGSNQTIITGNGTTGNNLTVGASTTIDASDYSGTASTGNTIQFNNLSIGAFTLNVTSSNAYSVQFAGSTTLTGAATFNPTTAGLILSGAVSDSGGGFTKTGAGALTLSGTNSYSGPTTLNGGTTTFQGSGALPSATAISIGAATISVLNDGTGSNGTISLGNSITDDAQVTATINVGNNGSANTGNTVAFGALSNGSASDYNSTFTFTGANGYLQSFTSLALPGGGGQTTTLNPTSTSVTILGNVTNSINTTGTTHYDTLVLSGTTTGNAIDGAISDSPGYTGLAAGDTRVTMSGTGAWTLAGANTYHGPTVVSSGTLFLTGSLANTAISTSGAGIFNESSGGIITGTTTLTTAGTGTSVLGGTNSYTGATSVGAGTTLSLTGSLANTAISTAGSGIFNESSAGSIAGTSSLTTAGTGTSVLAGTNSYTGATTVGAGTVLNVVNEVSLYNDVTANWTASKIIVASGGTLDLNVGGSGQFTNSDVTALAALGTASGGFESGSILGLDTTAGNFTLSNALANPNSGANVLGLTKYGTNTLTLSAANTYTGTTTVNAGTLLLSGSGTIGAAAGNSALTVNTGGNVDLNGTSQNVDNLSGSGTIYNNSGSGTSTLQIGSNNGTGGTFAGVIEDNNGVAGGIVALTKTGTGTITLSGADTYSGATSVNGGTLTLTGSLASPTLNMTGGTFAYSNPSGSGTQTFTTTDLSGSSTINNTVSGDTLNLGTLSRSAGSTIDFGTLTGTINTITANASGTGMLGAWATTGSGTSLSYAASAGTGSAEGAISAYAGGTNLPASGATEPNNYTLGNTGQTLTASEAGNTLQILNTDVTVITVGGAYNLSLNGILNSGGSGGGLTISTSTLTIGSTKELDIINGADGETINSIIADNSGGASSVVYNGGAGISLNGNNTYSGGTYINAGGVTIGNNNAFGTGTVTFGAPGSSSSVAVVFTGQTISNPISVNAGGTREIYTSANGTYTVNGLVTLNNGATFQASGNANGTATYNGGFAGTGNVIFDYVLAARALSGVISGGDVNMVGTLTDAYGGGGTGNLTVTSNIDSNVTGLIANTTAGSFILSGTNTNSGPDSAIAGTLNFVNEVSLFDDQTGSWTANNIIVNSGATLDLNVGGSGQFTNSDVVALAALGTATGGLKSGSTLELDTTGGNFNLSTALANPNSGANVLNFAKAGTNTLTISAAQTYTGTTTLSAGTTVLGVTNAIPSAIVSGGTTILGANNGIQSGGSLTMPNNNSSATAALDLAGFNQTLGALTISTTSGATSGAFNTVAILGDSIGSGTLTLTGGASAVTFSSTTGSPNGAIISATTVDLAGATQTFTVANSTFVPDGLTVSSAIQDGALTKAGTGGLLLTGANTYTGATTVSAGTLYIGTGGTAGSLASSGSIVDNATVAFNRADTVTQGVDFGSGISGSGAVKQNGHGTVVLTGSNSYTGGTTITSGTLQFAKTTAMPATGAVVANSGSVLAVNAGGTGEFAATGSGAGTLAGIFAGTGGQGAAVTLNSGSAVGIDTTNAGGSLTYAGNITNSGVGVTKLGTGTLVLSGTGNTYTGTTGVAAGTLQAGAINAFGTGSAVVLANTAGATLNLAGYNTAIASLSGGGTTGGNVTLGTAALTLANPFNNGISSTYAGIISGTGGSVVESGSGTQVLSGANTYTGGTTISSGTLQFALTTAMPASGTVAVSSGGTLAVNAGGTGEFTATTGTGSIAGLFGGTGGRGAGVTLATGSAIGVDTTDASGSLTDSAALNGNAGLTKLGTGTLILSGTNGYAGATSVNNGVLQVTGSIASSTTLNMGGGTFDYSKTGTNTLTLSTTNVNAGASTIANTVTTDKIVLGAINRTSGSTLNFASTGTYTTTAANTNGILGGYATYGGSSWAVGSGTVAALATGSYTNTATDTNNAAAYNALTGAASNIDVTASTGTMTGTITVNSLRFNTNAAETVTLATGTNILSSGGILVTSTVAANASTINGGTLEGSASGDLVISDFTSGTLTLNSTIANNGGATGLTFSGASNSTLVLGGGTNTYTGVTTVNGGTLALIVTATGNSSSSSIASSAVVLNSGATFEFDNGGGTESALVGSISGAGGVNVSINNPNFTTTFNLANTYTGPTTVPIRGILAAGVATQYNAAGNPISGAFGVNSALIVSTGAATVNLNGFDNQVGSISGSAGTILLNGATLTTGGDNTSTLYSGTIIGAGGLTKIGTGTQQLIGASTYTGQTIVNNGVLRVSAGGSVQGLGGSGPLGVGSNVTVNANQVGATALLDIGNQTVGIGSLTFGGQGGTSTSTSNLSIGIGGLILGGNVTFDPTNNPIGSTLSGSTSAGFLELNGNRTFTIGSSSNSGGADLTVSAVIDDSTMPYTSVDWATDSGGNSLTKAGAGVLVLSSPFGNYYSGATNINAGTLSINIVAAAGYVNGGTGVTQSLGLGNVVNMGSGSASDTLLYTGGTGTLGGTGASSFTINVLGTGTNTIKNTGTGTLTLADSIVKNGTTLTVTGAVNIAGVISGSLPNSDMDYNNATSTVSVAGTYTGPTHIFNNSTVTNGVNDALPDVNGGASGNSTLIMGDSSETGTGITNVYALGGYTQTLGGLTSTHGTNADTNEVIGNSSTLSTLTLAIASGTDTYAGYLGSGTVGSTNANNLALISNGAGTLVLTGANTYTGGTTVSTGTLQVGATSALGTGGSLVVNGGGTVDLNGFSPTVGALTLGSGGSTIAATSSGTLHTSGVTVNGTGNTINSGATVSGNATQSANSALVVNGALTGTDSLTAGTTSLSGTGSVSSTVTLNGGGNSIFSSGTLATGGIMVNNTGNTITTGTVTGLTTMASSSALTVNSGATLSPVAGISQGTSSALTVNGSTGADSLATSATLAGTGSTGAVTLAGSNTLSSTGTLTTSSISVSGSGNIISAGTVAGNTTINSGGFLSVSSGATASGTVGISSGGSLGGLGTTGAVTLASGGAINLQDGVIGTLTVGALSTTGGGSLSFDISGGGSTTVDKLADSGSLSISGVTTVNIGNLGNVSQSLANGTNTYQLLSFGSGSAVLSDFNLATTTLDSKTLSLSLSGNSLYLNITSPVSSTTYTLATSATSRLLHAGGSTALTTTLTNTGTGTADSISYSGVGASTNLGSVSGATISSPPTLANGGSSVSNTGQTFSTTTGTSGTATISSTGTLTNATLGGTPTGTPTGTSITVYSGYGMWNTNGSGTWGTAPTATPANWTAAGGTPGVTAGFTGVDTATFGAQTASAITVGLNSAAPNLNAITFSSPDTAYTVAQNYNGGTGTSSITLSGTTPGISVTNSGGSLTAGTQTISAPLILGSTTSLNVAANQTLNISGQISSSGTYGLSNSGPGTTMLSNASGNMYSGPTTISGGSVYITNTSGSATGSGSVSVTGGTLAGKGSISGQVSLSSGGSLYSGGVAGGQPTVGSNTSTSTTGLTLTNTSTSAMSPALLINSANLTFALGTDVTSGGGAYNFANPSYNSTWMQANGLISFTGNDTISLVDLTNTNGSNGTLSLRQSVPYVLISNGQGDLGFSGLVTMTGGGASAVYTLDGNGFVVGDLNAAGLAAYGSDANGSILSGFSSTDVNTINIAQFGAYGATGMTALSPGANGIYPAAALYLENGNLEVVPEPSTWVLMIGGLALLVAIQRRRNNS